MAALDAVHLVRRFFGAIRPGAPSSEDEAWARDQLNEGERDLWERMNNPDRRHAIGVARAVQSQLADQAVRPVLAAALLHDVGKVVSNYRTPARVLATVVWAVVPDDRAGRWADRGWPRRRMGEYHNHPELGEQLLVAAGADPITASWAGDHHKAVKHWRVSRDIGDVLKACDDD